MNREMFAPLTERYLAGDRRALEPLLLLSYRPVSCLCRKLLLNSAEAERITREVLVRICTLPESLPEPEQFEAWLRRFAAVRCVQTAALLPPEELESEDPPENVQIPRQTLDELQTALVVQQMADQLPEQPRQCLLLYCCGDIAIPTIARLLEISQEEVLDNLHRAQNNIHKQLRKFHKMGIRFAKVTSLPELLCMALYHSDDTDAARTMVNGILRKKMPSPAGRKNPIRRLLIIAAATALVLLLQVGILLICGIG